MRRGDTLLIGRRRRLCRRHIAIVVAAICRIQDALRHQRLGLRQCRGLFVYAAMAAVSAVAHGNLDLRLHVARASCTVAHRVTTLTCPGTNAMITPVFSAQSAADCQPAAVAVAANLDPFAVFAALALQLRPADAML